MVTGLSEAEAMIPNDVVHAVRDALRVSQVVSRRVKLRKAGRIWKGLCPFHSEKTPSFTVDDQRGTWKCFGCGEHGDVIEFTRLSTGLSFIEAVEELAKEAGVALPVASPEQAKQEARRLNDLEVLQRVKLWFQNQLGRYADVRAYLRNRGVSDADIEVHGLGFAPQGVERLAASVGGGVAPDALSRTGLAREEGDSYFRDRIIFPVGDLRGRTVGFGGRALGEIQPKYLNTPETELFKKGNLLYGADLSRQPAHDGQPLYVVEGYMDVIACRHHGVAAVAPMGTALTEAQLLGLWRLSDRPIIAFDGDDAGRKATRKALELTFRHLHPGFTIQALRMPQGRDPGSYMGDSTPDRFKAVLSAPASLSDAFWAASTAGGDFHTPDRLANLESEMVETLKTIPDRQLREKYIWDARQRVRTLGKPRAVIRANGQSYHSTNPATKRLLANPVGEGMTIKAALEVIDRGETDTAVLFEAQTVLTGVGLWRTSD